jgi:hypothetical protein
MAILDEYLMHDETEEKDTKLAGERFPHTSKRTCKP